MPNGLEQFKLPQSELPCNGYGVPTGASVLSNERASGRHEVSDRFTTSAIMASWTLGGSLHATDIQRIS